MKSGPTRDAPAPELVARAAAGDPAAQRALYDAHRPDVFRVARGFGGLDPDDVDDVVQETFVRAFRYIVRLEQHGRFLPWLLTIARNRALSRLARRKSEATTAAEFGREAEVHLDSEAGPTDHEAEVELELELNVVRKVIASLPEGAEKETVQLFYVEGNLSAREIAERLGVGKSAITMRLERFRAKVKKRILAEVARLRGEGSI
ncbi:MAG: sigma-70 family RNA polymerase sigma factor [Anaeromyxobacteraceae bacterium]